MTYRNKEACNSELTRAQTVTATNNHQNYVCTEKQRGENQKVNNKRDANEKQRYERKSVTVNIVQSVTVDKNERRTNERWGINR